VLADRTASTRPPGRDAAAPAADEHDMTFALKRWRWKLSPAARRARRKHTERVTELARAKRATWA